MILLALSAAVIAQAAAPLDLARAQELLFAQSPELRQESASADKARAQFEEARAAFLPSLDAFASYQAFTEANHIHMELPSPPGAVLDRSLGDRDREEYGIDLTLPLFTGGQNRRQSLSRRASLDAARETLAARRNQLSLRLAATYYGWLAADTAARMQEEAAAAWREARDQATAEVRQGTALKSREATARARWLAAENDALAAADLRDSLARAAALLLGLPPSAPPAFLPPAETRTPGPGGIPSAAERPELGALRLSAEGIAHQEKALLGQRLPTVTALAGYRLANPGLNLGGDDYMDYGVIGVQARWNLFDGFRNRARRAQLRAQRDALETERDRQESFWEETALSVERTATRLDRALEAARAAREAAREILAEREAQGRQGAALDVERTEARVEEARAALRVRQLELQRGFIEWQRRYARGETLDFSAKE